MIETEGLAGEVRAALQRELKPVNAGKLALIDIRLAKAGWPTGVRTGRISAGRFLWLS